MLGAGGEAADDAAGVGASAADAGGPAGSSAAFAVRRTLLLGGIRPSLSGKRRRKERNVTRHSRPPEV